ncbi:MAG: restriction endonuclease subunit S [Hydrococcus sp. Prado102]|jgi:type I restriction enzyme S subunit|nr:restriction endonuclease subunit S [Hydrococcus sp. Prado102]
MGDILVKTKKSKDLPLEKVPRDWMINIGEKCFTLHSGSIPLHLCNDIQGELLYLKVEDFNDPKNFDGLKQSAVTFNRKVNPHIGTFPPGVLVFPKRGAAIFQNRVQILQREGTVDPNLMVLKPISDLCAQFLRYKLIYFGLFNICDNSGVPQINNKHLYPLQFSYPCQKEQARIIEILDTIDEAIARTETLINKLKQMKAGLLYDLLTRGLNENGALRDPIKHPEKFKDSLLGRIPKEWAVYRLLETVPQAEYGISASLDDEIGIPVLRMNNLKDGEFNLTDLKKSASSEAASLLLKPLDVLFNRTNSIDHVGRTAIWRNQLEKVSFASYLVRLIPDTFKLLPEYLNIWLNLPTTQLLIRRYATPGVHQVNINPTNLRKVLIALPQQLSEQETIIERITAHNKLICQEETYKDKLKQQKKGLMHDLLTGKVRVKLTD